MRFASRFIQCVIVALLILPVPPALHVAADFHTPSSSPWQQPQPPAQPVQVGPLSFSVPANWLTWTYDEALTESKNETALIALVKQVDPALVPEATEVITASVPDMIAAAFAPDAPGGDLVYISLMAYGYTASLQDLNLSAQATPDQVIAALGFAQAEQVNELTAGFFLEEERTEVTFTGGFALPDLDRIILLVGGTDPLGWQQYGDVIQEAIRSFGFADAPEASPTPPAVPTVAGRPTAPASVPTGDLAPGQPATAELPILNPANPLYLFPYEFPVQGIMTGAVDLTRQPIDPILERIEGTDFTPPVVGFVTARPTFAFIARPTVGGTVGVVFAGINYADTVLLLRCPNGEWHFADDVRRANPDPAVVANLAQEGVYEVWIGTKLPNQPVTGTLYVLVQ